MVKVTMLMEDQTPNNRSLQSRHGVSYYIETSNHCYLFDSGPDDAFMDNALKLGCDLKHLDGIVLSHNHYDHANGFVYLKEAYGIHCPLYTGVDFLKEKYSTKDQIRYTKISSGIQDVVLEGVQHITVKNITKLDDECYVVTNFKRNYAFETIPSRFVQYNGQTMVQDDFHDEVCIVIVRSYGLVVITGCSHPGILNMLSSIQEEFKQPIVSVYGGLHLVHADIKRIHTTIEECVSMGIQTLGMTHCSGETAELELKKEERIQSLHIAAGDVLFL